MKKITIFALSAFCAMGLAAIAQEAETAKHEDHQHHDHGTDHEHGGTAWLSITECEICKYMSAQEGLMESMQWETHVIPTGMMHFTVIPDEMRPKMAAAEKGMQQTIVEIMQGQQKKCCGYCTSMGKLMMAGAKQTQLQTAGGDVMLVTSENPAVIKKIQAHAKKTKQEYAKIIAQYGDHDHQDGGDR